MTARHVTRPVDVGGILIGGGAPVVVQSMTNTDSRDAAATIAQVRALAEAGCELVRLAVPDEESAQVFAKVRKASPVPLVADIHFDYRLALASLEAGADKIRINPGNIGGPDRVRQVAAAAKARGVPIRVGVNSGSVPRDLLAKYGVRYVYVGSLERRDYTPESLAKFEQLGTPTSFGGGDVIIYTLR